MKRIITVLAIIAGASFWLAPQAKAQCNAGQYAESCISELGDGYTFLKSFQIDGRGGQQTKVEYSYVFSKDTNYTIKICSPGGPAGTTDGIKVTLYDSNRTKKGSSYVNGSLLKGFTYPCPATGIYYITFEFEGSSNFCGGSVLGFKR